MYARNAELYFAYGASLDREDWTAYCQRKGADPAGLRPVEAAVLPDMALRFSLRSGLQTGGGLDVEPRTGNFVHGMLFRPTPEAWHVLARKEVAPFIHEAFEWTAIRPDGTLVPVIAFRVQQALRETHAPPHPDYLRTVCRGLAAFGLPHDDLDVAASGREPAPSMDALFAYGTLLRGESRFRAVEGAGLYAEQPGMTDGDLHSTGGHFPALCLRPETDKRAKVAGDIQRFDDMRMALPQLDRVEGFIGYTPTAIAHSLYHRTIVTVSDRHGRRHKAWTYVIADPRNVGPRIDSGCWRTHVAHRRNVSTCDGTS